MRMRRVFRASLSLKTRRRAQSGARPSASKNAEGRKRRKARKRITSPAVFYLPCWPRLSFS